MVSAVLTEPRDLDRGELAQVVADCWELRDPHLEYMPVGFGSHHWRAVDSAGTRRFVTVDDLEATFRTTPDTDSAFAELDRAFRTAAALRENAALEFVVAPLGDRDGDVIRRLSHRYSITVSPFIEGESRPYGPYDRDDRRLVGALLGRLHAATKHVPAGLPKKDDLAIPSRAALVEALDDLDRSWQFGPFAEPTRKLLRSRGDDVERRLHEYDEVTARVRRTPDPWVVTHGEPHRGNIMRNRQGGLHLVDWDTALVAPRERDLQMVLDEHLTGWDEYREHVGVASLNDDALQLYRRWWDLADIAVFVAGFRRPHEETEDMVASWGALSGTMTQ
jgi:spectinomycin phosphotransferase